ncbi:hypothetical protein GDO78_002357 [Eleutherodactylus coqui]|uniref:Uncharacterized protein n=1 Tax=Eleutherodactylus coqui TaxID=57060 RepID=A0A8J6EXR4_ELECQ|nr:hypothetical protein GDO78_002357 [Eleutherodactylus coqui]
MLFIQKAVFGDGRDTGHQDFAFLTQVHGFLVVCTSSIHKMEASVLKKGFSHLGQTWQQWELHFVGYCREDGNSQVKLGYAIFLTLREVNRSYTNRVAKPTQPFL